MPGPILYSTNPWYSTEVANKYCKGVHLVWVSEQFDSLSLSTHSAAALIGATSVPKKIYEQLYAECKTEDGHSPIIKGYKKTFRRLAKAWAADKSITVDERDEILATVNSSSWRIWRPLLYVIPRAVIDPSRISAVTRPDRAAYGPELRIVDLLPQEFDIIEPWTF